jgi:hypothetical protein
MDRPQLGLVKILVVMVFLVVVGQCRANKEQRKQQQPR